MLTKQKNGKCRLEKWLSSVMSRQTWHGTALGSNFKTALSWDIRVEASGPYSNWVNGVYKRKLILDECFFWKIWRWICRWHGSPVTMMSQKNSRAETIKLIVYEAQAAVWILVVHPVTTSLLHAAPPVNTSHSNNGALMLSHCRRRWPNIETTLVKRFMFAPSFHSFHLH